MATVAEIEVPADEFALYETLRRIPDVEFEIERVVASDKDRVMPYVWITDVDEDALETALTDDPTVERFERISEQDGMTMYQMDWIDHIQMLVQMITEERATVMAAFGKGDHWDLRILFPERASLSRTAEYCEEQGVTFDVRRIYEHGERAAEFGLTEEQYRALETAFESGYYDIPRQVKTEELAESLGISQQATSERLRRGHRNVVEFVVLGHDEA